MSDAKFNHATSIAAALADAYDEGQKEAADTIEALRAENKRLLSAVNSIAYQPLSHELDAEELEQTDFKGAYDVFIKCAREVIGESDD